MSIDVRKVVALAELVAAVAEYEEFLTMFDLRDDSYSEIEVRQLAIARAFLRVSGIAAQPGELADGLIVESLEEIVAREATVYRKSPIPPELRWAVFRRDNFTCKVCGLQAHLHADHIVPESKGGATTFENLQTLCADCNRKKGARL